jgi:hypothetical protein
MKVRELVRLLTELDRGDAEVGIMSLEPSGSVTIQAARDATLFDGRGPGVVDAAGDAAVLIVGGRPVSRRPLTAHGTSSLN